MSTLIFRIPLYRLTEFGELICNCPMSKIPNALHVVVPWIGLFLAVSTILGLASKWKGIGPTEVYLLSYIVVLLAWPFYDTRLWLPVIPLLIAYSTLAVNRLRLPKPVVAVYCIVFAALGFTAIVYSTRISFSGSEFPNRYGDGTLRPAYCAVFQSCPDNGASDELDTKAIHLLHELK